MRDTSRRAKGSLLSTDLIDADRPVPAEYTALATDLGQAVEGEVRFDEYAQLLYATDGSIYQARPAGVVFPTGTADVRAAVETAVEHGVPILPRGAGSSLAGQAVGPGCVVLDLSRHMDAIVDVDAEAQRATVQPGLVQDHLETYLEQYGLKFAPDPASSGRATIGGSIGNNSTGAHSVRYGITDAYVEAVTAVLADGSVIEAGEVVLDSPEWDAIVTGDNREAAIYETVRSVVEDNNAEIEDRYPDLKRRVTGYNLDRVIYETDEDEVINLAKLFVGAEGTLGVVVEATIGLVTVPEETALALYCFEDLVDAMKAVPEALEFDVSAVELMDDEVFRLASESTEFAQYAEPIPNGTAAALMLEFDSDFHDDFEAAVAATTEQFVENGDAFDVLEAYTDEAQTDMWKLRKAAIPLLMGLEGDPKPYPFIEDATVPPAELAEYVQEFQDVLAAHDTSAAYFAHAGSGTLHIRPILNLKEEDGIEAMHSITDDVTELVLEHHGAFSGEHGDGMARTEFTPKMYGDDLWQAFKAVKTAFDPDWWLHPGNVVYRDGPEDVGPAGTDRGVGADNREHLRYGASYQSLEPQTALDFSDDGGFSHLVELCNGCGTCRTTHTDVMCPTYRASKDEMQTTRGRANMLRAAISGELPEEELYSEHFQEEVLDLCVGCKGCASDCPTGVDLAKLKAEVKHQYHEREGVTWRDRLFGNVDRASAIGSTFAPLSNWAQSLPGSDYLGEKLFGIAPERDLPTFRRETLVDWFETRGGCQITPTAAEDQVLLFPDTFTNYSYPAPGKAAVEILEAADVYVDIPEVAPSGRAAFSLGLLEQARERAQRNVDALAPMVDEGWSVVFVEPSDAVMFQDEYADLLDGDAVLEVGAASYGVCEYLDVHRVDERIDFDGEAATDTHLTYHGHCNQKATNKDHHTAAVLRRAGYDVDHLDSSCCGMAGSFGYEAEHYELSKAIGQILYDQVDESPGEEVVAPGASCRTQLGDRPDGDPPPHPVERLRDALDK